MFLFLQIPFHSFGNASAANVGKSLEIEVFPCPRFWPAARAGNFWHNHDPAAEPDWRGWHTKNKKPQAVSSLGQDAKNLS
jgi:hypothetical protein